MSLSCLLGKIGLCFWEEMPRTFEGKGSNLRNIWNILFLINWVETINKHKLDLLKGMCLTLRHLLLFFFPSIEQANPR